MPKSCNFFNINRVFKSDKILNLKLLFFFYHEETLIRLAFKNKND